jgi:methionine sulfoxide reductase heme-binding subunit
MIDSMVLESLGLEGEALWFLNRSTGVVSIVLLTISTVLGVLAIGGRPAGRVPRFVTQAFHRNVALLSVLLLVAHLITVVLDEFVEIRWYEVFIPFVGSYEPLWVGFGALATDLMIVVVITSLFRTRMNHNLWRGLHVTTYGLWALAIGHGIGVGTDMTESMWVLTVVCAIAVPLAAALRLGRLVIDRTSTSSTTPGGLK